MIALRRLFLLALVFLFVTCNGTKQAEHGTPNSGRENIDPAAHFEFTPETVVIRNANAVVRNISPDRSTFTLDGSAPGVQSLAPGKVMLLAGVDAGRVLALRKDGKDFVVTVGPVKITDVIRNGTITWSPKDMDLNRGMWMSTEPGTNLSTILEPPENLQRLNPNATFESLAEAGQEMQNKVKITVGDWKVELTFKEGSITLYAAMQKLPLFGGITVTVNTGKPQTSGRIVVQQGKITDSEIDMPVDGYAELDTTSRTEETPAFPGKAVIELPIEWVVPIETPYFIPFYVGLKVNFIFQPEMPTKNTLLELKLHYNFRGNMGFELTRGAFIKKTKLIFDDNPTPEITGTGSMGDVAALFAFQMPRVSVGLGARSVASAGMFMDLVSAVTLNIASATSMFPCRSMTLTETVSAGFEYEVGPDTFKAILKKLNPNTKVKGEVHKIEVQKWSPNVAWYEPRINACKP